MMSSTLISLFLNFLMFIYFERERERQHKQGRDREERERIPSRLFADQELGA